MNLSNKPQQAPDYKLESIDDELLLFHPSQTTIIYCNSTASLVWQLCDGERTVADIIHLLKEAYPEAKDLLIGDIQTSLNQFAQQGAIRLN